ncbi:hypothetical protein PoB_000098500, partial [Plakobranchus ocellatus]
SLVLSHMRGIEVNSHALLLYLYSRDPLLTQTPRHCADLRPQRGDLRLSGPPSGQGAGGEARTRDRRVPADLMADSLPTAPLRLLLLWRSENQNGARTLCR